MATNKVSVTNYNTGVSASGSYNTETDVTKPSGFATGGSTGHMARPGLYHNGYYYLTAWSNSSPYTQNTVMLRSSDLITWNTVSVPAGYMTGASNGIWAMGGNGNNLVMLENNQNSASARTLKSTDNGATWAIAGNRTFSTALAVGIASNSTGRTFATVTSGFITSYNYSDNYGTSWTALTGSVTGMLTGSTNQICASDTTPSTWVSLHNYQVIRSLSNGASGTWSLVNGNIGASAGLSTTSGAAYTSLCCRNGVFYALAYHSTYGAFLLKSPDNGATWASYKISNLGSPREGIFIYKDMLYTIPMSTSNYINISKDAGTTWVTAPMTGTATGVGQLFATSGAVNQSFSGFLPISGRLIPAATSNDKLGVVLWSSNTNPIQVGLISNFTGGSGLESYINVTATYGSISQTLRLPVKLANPTSDMYTMQLYPSGYALAATSDGEVYPAAYTSDAKITATIWKNGIDDTPNWSIVFSNTSGLTTTTTASSATITTLTKATSVATITVSATKVGAPGIVQYATITKNLGSLISGPVAGSNYSAFSGAQTSIYIKFKTNGYFQIKYGAGSYTNAGIWYNPPNEVSPAGGNYYMTISYTSDTSDTLQAGTNGGIIGNTTGSQMNVDREFYISNAATGSHRVYLTIHLDTSSSMGNATKGTGILELLVP